MSACPVPESPSRCIEGGGGGAAGALLGGPGKGGGGGAGVRTAGGRGAGAAGGRGSWQERADVRGYGGQTSGALAALTGGQLPASALLGLLTLGSIGDRPVAASCQHARTLLATLSVASLRQMRRRRSGCSTWPGSGCPNAGLLAGARGQCEAGREQNEGNQRQLDDNMA